MRNSKIKEQETGGWMKGENDGTGRDGLGKEEG